MITEKEREKTFAAPARKMIKCPQKTGINMNQHEKRTGTVLTLVIGCAVIALLAGFTAKVGVIDQYRRLSQAQAAYAAVHKQLTDAETALEDYDRVLMEYRTYSMDWMTASEEESDLVVSVPRQDVLDMVERVMLPHGSVQSIDVRDDTAEIKMTGDEPCPDFGDVLRD